MWDCERALRDLVGQIEPSATQKAAASTSHNYLRSLMDSGQFGNRILDSYLSGSYARDTALSPIDDVDIIFVVDPRGWSTGLFASRPRPDQILQSFASAVRYRYPNSSVYTQRRSVRLSLNHLAIDVVPAINKDSKGKLILIPDSNSDEWIVSAPKIHTEIGIEINKTAGGRFKPLVKLLKFWNSNLPKTAKIKSFAIETIAATLFRHITLPSLQDGLRLYFDYLAELDDQASLYKWKSRYGISLNAWAFEIPDLAGTGSNLVSGLDSDRGKKFLEHAIRSRDVLIAAERARTLDASIGYIAKALRA
jgi:hypothetical protein